MSMKTNTIRDCYKACLYFSTGNEIFTQAQIILCFRKVTCVVIKFSFFKLHPLSNYLNWQLLSPFENSPHLMVSYCSLLCLQKPANETDQEPVESIPQSHILFLLFHFTYGVILRLMVTSRKWIIHIYFSEWNFVYISYLPSGSTCPLPCNLLHLYLVII
jgi:hypothetical protein